MTDGVGKEAQSTIADSEKKSFDIENLLRHHIRILQEERNRYASELQAIRTSKSFRLLKKVIRWAHYVKKLVRGAKVKLRKNPISRGIQRYKLRKCIGRLDNLHATLTSEAAQLGNEIPTLRQKHHKNVAIITDGFMYNYYKNVFSELYWLKPSDCIDIVESNNIDVLLYVSCWRGGDSNEWRGHVRNQTLLAKLEELVTLCKKRNIKTVFQTIEDPSNFEHFLPIARLFDNIFTSDSDMVSRYRKELPGKDVIKYGEYGFNPEFNNPLDLYRFQKRDAFFAGSYPRRYRERCKDMEVIFDSLVDSDCDLVIADRNKKLNLEEYFFPAKYAGFVVNPFEHKQLQSVHKLFKLNVNLNSIKHSPTMCAMRVYELQAQGASLVSNYSRSVSNRFPNIDIVAYKKSLIGLVDSSYMTYSAYVRSVAIFNMFSKKKAFDQVGRMLQDLGLSVDRQVFRVLVLGSSVNEFEGLGILEIEYTSECETCMDNYDFVVRLSQTDAYSRYFIIDLFIPFLYASCSVTFASTNPKLIPYSYSSISHIEKTSGDLVNAMMPADVWGNAEIHVSELSEAFCVGGIHLDVKNKFSEPLSKPVLSVVIPVYNNGNFLRDRCIKSLTQNSRFSEFEIILIDDSSSCPETIKVLNDLERMMGNVRVLSTGLEHPSGTASYPRNIGVQAAQSELVTFLDPDNLISPNGYTNLLSAFFECDTDGDLDVVFGYQVKVEKKVNVIGKLAGDGLHVFNDPLNDVLLAKSFPTVSTQASVIKRRTLLSHGLDYINGAIGQDTTYGFELLAIASKVAFSDKAYIEYYADRGESVTNTVNTLFFERSLILEREQKKRLQKHSVWDEYKELKSESFIKGWYFQKLRDVDFEDFEASKRCIEKIMEINGLKDEFLANFKGFV